MIKKKIAFVAQSDGGVAEYLYMFLKNLYSEKYEKIKINIKTIKNEKTQLLKKIFLTVVKTIYNLIILNMWLSTITNNKKMKKWNSKIVK